MNVTRQARRAAARQRAARLAAALLATHGPHTPWECARRARVTHGQAVAQLYAWADRGWLVATWAGHLRGRRVYRTTTVGRVELELVAGDEVAAVR